MPEELLVQLLIAAPLWICEGGKLDSSVPKDLYRVNRLLVYFFLAQRCQFLMSGGVESYLMSSFQRVIAKIRRFVGADEKSGFYAVLVEQVKISRPVIRIIVVESQQDAALVPVLNPV